MTAFPTFIVTIPRAKDRLDAILSATEGLGFDLRPIDGIDGSTIPEADWLHFNSKAFIHYNGRTAVPGEYGCYASHIKAIETFLEDGAKIALIVEDDVVFDKHSLQKILDVISVTPEDALVKLTCHRRTGFVRKAQFENGVTLGRYLCGPQGSAAAYLITRKAAERILETSKQMIFPFDRIIENGWDNHLNVLNTKSDILKFGNRKTLIATCNDYRLTKFSKMKRIPKYIKAAYDNVARMIYAVS